ncbi:S1 RNA-binding domain-containing protein [Streptomyces erythrochromogenes]|uniref:S1 RNA-binding domain-containing protein n=1 Tax=Streptomyces erythrochromogenes TaxID=285574 RepID=UPI00386EF24E|nr:S1 RNA-binding domain-containing protein [Streptomyces erythrochromogenes]
MTDLPSKAEARESPDSPRIGEVRPGRVVSISEQEVLVELDASAASCEDPALRAFLLGLRRGEIRAGRVRSVHPFGVFVNLDGEPEGLCTGFVRVPELTWSWDRRPEDVVAVGRRVVGEVLDVDTRVGQVQLSLKALRPQPLVSFVDRVGQTVLARVTGLVPFGALVSLAGDVQGLVHNTELTDEPVDDPGLVVSEGDEIAVRIVAVDLERSRISLSARDPDHT